MTSGQGVLGPSAAEVLDLLPAAVLVVDADGTVLYANAAQERMLGYGPGELAGGDLSTLTDSPAKETQRRGEPFFQHLREVGAWCGRWCNRRRDGTTFYTSARLSATHWHGRACYICVHDEELPEQDIVQEQFETLADSMPNLAWIARADGSIIWYNRRWYEYTGTTPEQMRGWGWQSVQDPDMLPMVLARWKESLAEGRPFEMVFPLRAADGTYRPFLTRSVPLLDAAGNVDRWFGTNTDISAQVESEVALRTVEDRLLRVVYASSRLLQARSVSQVVAETVEIAPGLIHAEAAAIWRAEPDGTWSVVASKGLSESYLQNCRRVRGPALQNEIIAIADVQADTVAQVRSSAYASEGIRGMLCVPLNIRGGLSGTLVFYFHSVHDFSEAERDIAGSLGNVAASAIASAELFEREEATRRRAEAGERRAEFLADAAAILHSSRKVEYGLAEVAAHAIPGFADYVCIEAEGRMLAEANSAADRLVPANQLSVDLPLAAGVNGRIVFGSRDPERRWDSEEVRLVDQLAVRVGAALENARLHRELREAGERANLAMEAAELGTWDYDLVSRRITLSPRTREFFGFAPNTQVTPERLLARLHPEDRHRVVDATARAGASDYASYHVEYRVVPKGGSVRWLLSNGCAMFEGEGPERRPVRMIGVVRDITAARTAEHEKQALLAREQEARSTAELLNRVGPLLLAELDRDRLVQKLVEICTRLVGAQRGKLTAEFPVWEVVRVADCYAEPPLCTVPAFGEADVRSLLAVPVHAHTGESFGTLVFGHSDPNIFGPREEQLAAGIAAQAAIALDNARLFEEALRVQQALHKANLSLRSANTDLEQFAFAAAHDLREPLRMVTTYTQLLERKLGARLDPDVKPFMKQIVDGAGRMFDLLQDLLSYTNTATQHEPAGPVELGAALQVAMQNLDATIRENEAEVHAGPLPVISGRMGHMVLVFQNLIGNAMKYRKKDVAPRVDISAEKREGGWLIRVTDNGIGIDPRYHSQIFGVFKRLHGREIPGTGIGLAICQRAVERAGGTIWVESTPGEGSSFLFTLPARPADAG